MSDQQQKKKKGKSKGNKKLANQGDVVTDSGSSSVVNGDQHDHHHHDDGHGHGHHHHPAQPQHDHGHHGCPCPHSHADTSMEAKTVEQLRKIEEIQRNLELLKLSKQALSGGGPLDLGQPKNAEEAKGKKYEFWETQPVPQMNEPEVQVNEPIDPSTNIDKVPKAGFNLPEGFVWCSIDIESESELQELYTLLFENYVEDDDNMFRFNYSRAFLLWVLKPPGCRKEWYCGVRVAPKPDQTKLGKLVGFVSAIPAKVKVYDKSVQAVEINFLCVHKKLRSKRMTPVLIKEITRRVNLCGIWQALYTAGVFIPKPIATCRYYHRSLNPKKLIETGFSSLTRNMNLQRMTKLYKLPEQTQLAGTRPLDPKKDLEQVKALLEKHMEKFDLVPHFDPEEIAHWLSPVPEVIESWVVERPSASGNGKELVGFFSFYILPSTVMNHKQHKEIKAAYSFYNVLAPGADFTLTELMNDALIVAKNVGMDVFNALNQMENDQFLQNLKFGSGDGSLHYYLFNWKCAPLKPDKIGVVLQ